MEVKDILHLAVEACDDKRAEDIIALDMDQVSMIADYFLICHGSNERQVQAIARSIKEKMDEHDIPVKRIEGLEHARWVLVDLGDIVCHVFHKEERTYYNIERLWGDASQVPIQVGND
ncbi:ribosome silencing factor [Ornithinibacillus halophilus]|uniref:Ribosomal silencing factor RsfS n=1 Tax=Ornithinibacillus halophilus TaxID=930117 RepID=A0A1M5DKU5_9BACI|nr:ribosome silencing factor [Ornithinibacillus halophilus]SHF67382.1 ribosome-associated protein [Ornithinibacillus halophilus]